MKHRFALFIGLLVALFLVAYMFAYQVRYDQIVVVTTFNKADPEDAVTDPGLYFKWPWPIQEVHTFSRLDQLLEDELRELQTTDSSNLIVRTYMTWRIDPAHVLDFFINLESPDKAPDKLRPLLGVKINEAIGRYPLTNIVNTNKDQVKLSEIEQQTLASLREEVARLGYGVRIEHVGIRRMVLPQEVTLKVFETMRKTRERLAANASSEGQAQADRITSQAKNAAERIRAFASRRAAAIRAEGNMEAARLMSQFKANETLAIFLQWVETIKKTLANNSQFILSGDRLMPGEQFMEFPDLGEIDRRAASAPASSDSEESTP